MSQTRVSVARGDRHDHSLIHAMNLLLRPAIRSGEVVKHIKNYIGDSIAGANSAPRLDPAKRPLLYRFALP